MGGGGGGGSENGVKHVPEIEWEMCNDISSDRMKSVRGKQAFEVTGGRVTQSLGGELLMPSPLKWGIGWSVPRPLPPTLSLGTGATTDDFTSTRRRH